MSEQGPQGYNGVTLSDRAVRFLGVEIANTQIALATQGARWEELVEATTHINFELWNEVPPPPMPEVDEAHEGGPILQSPTLSAQYVVPAYQADAVARLLSMIRGQ